MNIFKKIFCGHKWKQHAKEHYKWHERKIVPHTAYWYTPELETHTFENTVEVLICEVCGKIKKIKY